MDLSFKENFINTREAGIYSGYTPDYIARLIRSEKIVGQKIGHSWFVNRNSFDLFLVDKHKQQQKDTKISQVEMPSPIRPKESRTSFLMPLSVKNINGQLLQISSAAITLPTFPSLQLIFERGFLRHLLALGVAFVVVAFGAFGAQVITSPQVVDRVTAIASQTAEGFEMAFGALPGEFVAKITAAGVAQRAGTLAAGISSFEHSSVAFPPVRIVPLRSFSFEANSRAPAASIISVDTSSFFADVAGGATHLAHLAISADVSFAYGIAKLAPQSAQIVTVAFIDIGTFLAENVSSLPALASRAYLNLAAIPAIWAPSIAETVLRAEYVGTNHLIAFVSNVSLSDVIDASRAMYVNAGGALASVQTAIGRILGFSAPLVQ